MIEQNHKLSSLYSKIIQNLKTGNANSNKLYIIHKPTKPAFKINLNYLNSNKQAQPKFIDRIVNRKPVIEDHEKALESELAQFRKEVEDKYTFSKANALYKFKRTNDGGDAIEEEVQAYDTFCNLIYRTLYLVPYIIKRQYAQTIIPLMIRQIYLRTKILNSTKLRYAKSTLY
jgi:hypothetical protein